MIDLARWYMGEIVGLSAPLANYGACMSAGGIHKYPANDSVALLGVALAV